jgi:lipopolysaccharide export system ATP-binding protein
MPSVTEDTMPILEVKNLEKSYRIPRTLRRRKVVDGVSFTVEPGQVVGLLGPNGAGKTTCFRMACGLVAPDRGQVFLNGIEVTRWPMHLRAKDGGMGYLAQESSVFRSLSVEENLIGMMEMLEIPRKERLDRCDELLGQLEIEEIRKSKAASLSGGERRRLEIARALISDPDIILLDEPFAGVDPVTVENIQKIIRQLRDDGIAILITDHQVRETLAITEHSYVIRSGKVLCDGPPDEVIRHPEARRFYFGEGIEIESVAAAQ